MEIKGIDVSKWQGNINWNEVKKDGTEFAIIREGLLMCDKEALEV